MSIVVAVVLFGIAIGVGVYFFTKKSAGKAVTVVTAVPVVEPTTPKGRPIDEPAKPGEKLP